MSWCTAWHSCQRLQYEYFRAFGCQSEGRFVWVKTKHFVLIRVFGEITSDAVIMLSFILSSDSTRRSTSSSWKRYCQPGSRGGLSENLTSGNRLLHDATQTVRKRSSWKNGHLASNKLNIFVYTSIRADCRTGDNFSQKKDASGGVILFTNPSARAGYDTRSIFKRSLTGLNSEFSFS